MIDPNEERIVGFKRIPQTEDDFDDNRQKISVIFPGLDPESEYQAILTTDVKDKNDPTADPNKSDETIIKIVTNEVSEKMVCNDIGDNRHRHRCSQKNTFSKFSNFIKATAIEPVKEETLAIEQMSNVICLIFTEIRYDVDSYRVSITESESLNSIPMVQKVSSFSNEQEIRVSFPPIIIVQNG